MQRIVEIPGYGEVEFPDSMTNAQVNAAAKKLYDEKVAETQQAAFSKPAPLPIPKGLQPEPPQPERTFMESTPAMAGGLTGAYTGAAYGGAIGGPVGAALGGVAGAGLGAFGGELLRQGTNAALGYENPLEPQRAADEANTNMVGEITGQALSRTVPLIGAGFQKMNPFRISPADAKVVASAAARRVPLTVAERTGGKALPSALETHAERGMLGAGSVQTTARSQSAAALQNWWEPEILDALAPHMDDADIGMVVQQALGKTKERQLGRVSRMFDKATAMASNVVIDAKPIVTAARDLVDSPAMQAALRLSPSLADDGSVKILRQIAAGDELLPLPYETAEILRKAVQSIPREASHIGAFEGKMKVLGSVIDASMENAMKSQAPDAYKVWRGARQLWGPRIEQFGSRGKEFPAGILRKLADANPEKLVETLAKSDLNGLEQARDLLKFNPVWKNVQRAVLENAMEQSLTKEASSVLGEGAISARHWQTMLNKNLPALERILDKDTLDAVKEFNSVVRRFRLAQARSGNPSGTAQAIVKAGDVGALLTLADQGINVMTGADVSGSRVGGSATWLLTPRVLGRVLTSPGGARLLTEGLRVNRGSEVASRILGQLTARLPEQSRQQ